MPPLPAPASPPPREPGWRSLLGVAPLTAALAIYTAPDRESAEIRAAHLGAVLRLTPQSMAANVVNAALLGWLFFPQLPTGYVVWLVVLAGLVAVALKGSWHHLRHPRTTASPRAIRRATAHAAAIALTWSALPLFWFASAPPGHQTIMAAIVVGLIGAGGFLLSPLLAASLAYVGVLTVSSLVALVAMGGSANLITAAFLLCYATVVALGVRNASAKATALQLAQRESARQGRLVTVLLKDFEEHAAEARWQTEPDGTLAQPSARLTELLAMPNEQLHAKPLLGLLGERSPEAAGRLRQAFDASTPFRDLRIAVPGPQGQRWWSFSGKRLLDESGRNLGWRGVLADVTVEVQAHERLHRMAHTDSLTGLANRLKFQDDLREAMARDAAGALLFIDLDHFKAVNDSLGHAGGDALLGEVARRLVRCVRAGDLVARLGGDEFAVLAYRPCGPDAAAALARRIIDAIATPLALQGRRLQIGGSVGLAMCDDDAATVSDMQVRADMALYAAKEAGRGHHVVFETSMAERSRRRLALEEGLRSAVSQGQLHLLWQPKVDIAGWRIVSAEALLRWQHPVLGAVGPAEFVPIAEQSGLIHDIGTWTLREACSQAARQLEGLNVSVNVSPAQFVDGHFVTRVEEALHLCGIAPSRLELEITESIFMDDASRALEQLHALRRLGVRVALDDFGTGYSSLAYLRRFPFDTLKIDRSFVSELLLRQDARAIVRLMLELAGALGMRTVAEGIESLPQLAALAEAGCHEVQGFLISAPRDVAAFGRLRRDWVERSPLAAALH